MRLFVALLLLAPGIAVAAPISVGGTSIEIPEPDGFVRVTPAMAPLYTFKDNFVVDTNVEYALFIPADEAAVATAGEIPPMARRFVVQTAKKLEAVHVRGRDFAALKDAVRDQNADIARKLEAAMPGIVSRINAGVSADLGAPVTFDLAPFVPLPAHRETDRSLAYSARMRYSVDVGDGQRLDDTAAMTATLVHVRGRVLFLYTYGAEDDMRWTQDAGGQWAERVVAANPSDPVAWIATLFNADNRIWLAALLAGALGAIAAIVALGRPRRTA